MDPVRLRIVSAAWLGLVALLSLLLAIITNRIIRLFGREPEEIRPFARRILRILGALVFAGALYFLFTGKFPHVR